MRFLLSLPGARGIVGWSLAIVLGMSFAPTGSAQIQRSGRTPRCIALELYVDGSQDEVAGLRQAVENFVQARKGTSLHVYDVAQPGNAAERVNVICTYFKQPPQTPILYGCGRLITGSDPARVERELRALTTVEIFVRAGCPRCAGAEAYLPTLQSRYPGFAFRLREIVSDPAANRDLQELTRKYRTTAASVPVFHACSQIIVGWDSSATTGARLEALLNRWTVECRAENTQSRRSPPHPRQFAASVVLTSWAFAGEPEESDALPLPGEIELPLPGENAESPPPPETAIDLPWLGRVEVNSLGLPLFTLAVGLVDGFNPCAMWVLVFLLSVLVNLHSRWKILAVAGTFVAISGLAYLAFMAAWLSVFLWAGLLPWVRITLAAMAIVVGGIHVKDFFAFKQGVSLSIPESAKPGIYERVRRIVTAENLTGAVLGAAVLAVLVNMIELLCTAGLPALYTQILTAQGLPIWLNYAYLLLYIAAYMFDDTLMVGLVTVTLQRRKMQETQGRWLKLVSGSVILGLGLIMLVRPSWIGMSG